MKIRHSTEQDFDRMMEIYGYARKYMAEHGNPNQWGPTNWPPEDLIHCDIRDGNSYVCLNDAGKVIGTSLSTERILNRPTGISPTAHGSTTVLTVSSTELPETDLKKGSVHSVSTGLSSSADTCVSIRTGIIL